jgi:hypothetical protein
MREIHTQQKRDHGPFQEEMEKKRNTIERLLFLLETPRE